MRNKTLDIYKFIFCCVIALFHFYKEVGGHFLGGAGGVEFFVIAAALFFYGKLERSYKADDTVSGLAYAKKRFLRFFPYTTAAFVVSFLIRRVWILYRAGEALTLDKMYRWLSGDLWELLLIDLCGLNNGKGFLYVPAWTISAMLICEFIVWTLCRHNKKLFCTIIAPFSILFILGFWRNIESADFKTWIGFTTFGVLRVFLCYCLAYFVYAAARKLAEMKLTSSARALLTIAEISALLVSLWNMEHYDSRYFRYENILLFCILLLIAFSGQSYTNRIFRGEKLTKYLGELSFAVYLTHYSVLIVINELYPEPEVLATHIWEYIAITLAVSVVFDFVMKYIVKAASKLFAEFKRKMIVSE